MENALNFQSQAERYLVEIATRKRKPVKPNTLQVYRSILDARILPTIGKEDLADVDNQTAKLLVDRLTEAQLRPATINLAVTLVKQVVASAADEKGNQLYPRTWNTSFIQTPEIDPTSQKAPICALETLQEAVRGTSGEIKALIALLAGTGLRIGEALGIGLGNVWDPIQGSVTVSGTLVMGKFQPSPKTKAGKRVVDLPPAVNDLLKAELGTPVGAMFKTHHRTLRRRLSDRGIEGFHSLRRFRITHLQSASAPTSLIKFWAGHAAGDITERYTKMGAQVLERKDWSVRAGLGFELK